MFMERIKKGWNELEEEVIEAGKCVYCGACGAFCDDVKFDKDTEKPYDDGSCEEKNTCKDGYGVCYNLCPKTGIESFPVNLLDKWVFEKEHDNILGHYKRIVSVKLTEKGKSIIKDKEAGPLTALLATAMAEKEIDCAIVNKHDKKFRPVPYLAEKIDQLSNSTGYKPSQAPTLSLVGDAINQGFTDIAVVGTPCQMHALRKLQNHPRFDYEAYDLVSLAIGTFCFGTFHNKQLNQILEEYQIRPEDITKVERDEKNFNLNFYTNGELTSIPLNKVYDYSIRKACFACSDYTSSFADIAVGNVGSDPNWDTLIIRNDRGNEIVQLAVDNELIEIKEMLKDKKETILDITRRKCDIVEIERIQEHSKTIKSFWLRDSRIAKAYRPGNFVVLWIPDIDFLPMSVSQIEGDLLEITVEKVGEGTEELFKMEEGDEIGIRGPYGNDWNYEDASNILVVGGGMGIAAITSLIEPLKQNKKDVFVAIGAKDQSSMIFEDRLRDLIPNTICTTDDGSIGRKCYVTDPIGDIIEKNNIDLILACGPEIMMKRVLEIAKEKDISLQASLERKMKCGVGLCGSCCIGEDNDIAVCKDGPIFSKAQLIKFTKFGTYKK